jgi:TonB family protein
MFEDSLIESSGQARTKKGATVLISTIVHVVLLVVLILIPLIYTEALPQQQLLTFLVAPPPPPPPPPPPQRVRVGGNVQQANLLQQVRPVYPPLAKQARIQGVVVLEAVISKEGTIDNLKVITGHPLLIQAAIDAVKQWRYKPTMLNGEPVEVVTTITVNFAFSQ